ncbi:hypothetical protein [Brevundimonas sp.]|uniref:hypothetical protein n=1 Tax=Brevundimonas sp. TaxID=1871086 RepID=UPI00286BACCB|nr:hypothetical protein [Brevundimonas sp.]
MAHPLSRTDVRLGLAALALAGLIGAGAFILGGSETGRSFGRGLAIAVIPAVEPEVLPGETMEVGALSDGFDRAALERVAELPLDDTLPSPAWVGDESLGDPTPRMPMPTPVSPSRVVEVAGPSTDPLADGSRAFGFDQPRPDYAAERALRWGRMEPAERQSATAETGNEGGDAPQYSPQ